MTPPARQRRPADYDLASPKANVINVGQGRRQRTTHGTPRRRGCWGTWSPCSLWIRRGQVGPGRQGIGVLALFRPPVGKVADRAHTALRAGARERPFAARLAQATMAAQCTGDKQIRRLCPSGRAAAASAAMRTRATKAAQRTGVNDASTTDDAEDDDAPPPRQGLQHWRR